MTFDCLEMPENTEVRGAGITQQIYWIIPYNKPFYT